jgi:nicotinamide-nucleotide amidase
VPSASDLAGGVLAACRARGLRIATAESCTGGMIAAALTDPAGASDVVECGFVVYSNEAKQRMLGVSEDLLMRHGAVSAEVAVAMAEGALARSSADLAVAVTGIAGPGGATATKPVGLVHLACVRRGCDAVHRREVFPGDRAAVRARTVATALEMIEGAAAS